MAITEDQVKHVALLARLDVSEQALRGSASQLGRILEYVNLLEAVDTSLVKPTLHVLADLHNVARPDSVIQGLSAPDALAAAPGSRDGMFQVPAVIEDAD